METGKGKVRRIFNGGKRVHIAKNHSLCEIDNDIPDLKIGGLVECSDFKVLRKLEAKENEKSPENQKSM
jgi:hypothetical protein